VPPLPVGAPEAGGMVAMAQQSSRGGEGAGEEGTGRKEKVQDLIS